MLEKISDLSYRCISKEHNPPNNIYLTPGVYRWTCPECGQTTIFTITGIAHEGRYQNE